MTRDKQQLGSIPAWQRVARRVGQVMLAVGLAWILALMVLGPPRATSGPPPEAGDGVVASVPPLAWPLGALAPGRSVTLLTPVGASPHGATLSPAQAGALADAGVVLLIGWGKDAAAERVLANNPRTGRTVIRLEDIVAAREDLAGVANDPHAWLDPTVMRDVIVRLAEALDAGRAPIDRARAGVLRDAALGAAGAIDAEYRAGLAGLERRAIIADHAAYGYLAARYGLTMDAAIHAVEGVEPSPGDIRRVAEAVDRAGARAIFVEPQFPRDAARRIAERAGVELVEIDPLGGADWPATMRANLEALRRGLGAPDAAP